MLEQVIANLAQCTFTLTRSSTGVPIPIAWSWSSGTDI
jgi:hypothetical protein